ncbi:hypothetical protein ACFQZR_13455 [Paenibacillus sp. GCM10027629]|uniref:hypothetical protein n=1 Tax=Paenibacillus sp. GCM10027629 TaxID=3273414 RepID=UPI003643686F
MKKTAIVLALTITTGALVGQVWAEPAKSTASQATTTIQSVKSEQNQPFANAGIDDPKVFTTFLAKLQKAVAEDNLNEVATYMSYPLNLIKNSKKIIIYTKEQFVQKYDRIMTSHVQKKLLAQNAEDVFVNAKGIMIGEGEMWISVIDQQLAVYAIHAMENPYEVAGIDNPAAFTDFLSKLQKAVVSNNKKEVANFISYPLHVNQKGKTVLIKSKKQFIEKYNQIMTDKVKEKLLAQKAKDVFVNWQGVMVGDGEVWIRPQDEQIVVFAINK